MCLLRPTRLSKASGQSPEPNRASFKPKLHKVLLVENISWKSVRVCSAADQLKRRLHNLRAYTYQSSPCAGHRHLHHKFTTRTRFPSINNAMVWPGELQLPSGDAQDPDTDVSRFSDSQSSKKTTRTGFLGGLKLWKNEGPTISVCGKEAQRASLVTTST